MTLDEIKKLPKLDETGTFFGLPISELDREGLLVLAETLRRQIEQKKESQDKINRLIVEASRPHVRRSFFDAILGRAA